MAFSPMMRHYLETKENYKDCILLYRLGDFYEMFFDDAVTASSTLDLVLTGRDCGDGQRAPMCGVPFRAVDNYVAKLIGAGYKVAICEQLEDPKQSVGIVDRGVIRVITPGTVMESAILEDKQNNYIASIVCGNLQSGEISCAICDISTGEFYATEFFGATSPKDLSELLVTFRPSEILGNTSAIFLNSNLDCFKSEYVPKIEPYYDWAFDFKKAEQCIKQQYKVNSVEGFGLADHMLAVSCSGALLQYILDTQKRQLPHLMPIKLINRNSFMSIDIKTRRNLELTVTNKENKRKGSLLWLLDNTKTSMGGRMISGWLDKPLQNIDEINNRLGGVDEIYNNFILRETLSELLVGFKDIERISGKISYNSLTTKDCKALQSSLQLLPLLKDALVICKSGYIKDIYKNLQVLPTIITLIESAIVDEQESLEGKDDGKLIKHGYDAQLDELLNLVKHSQDAITALQEKERQKTGIKSLKLGYNRVFGYYFEISNSFKQLAPNDYIRKQTLTNGERYVNQELKDLEEKILSANEKSEKLETELFQKVRMLLLEYIPQFQKIAYNIAKLDCILSFAKVSVSCDYKKPTITTGDTLQIIEGRHPIVEKFIKNDTFISNDTLLDTAQNRTMVITGPNMSGKSTYMRQVALITLMAHIGCFVPCKSATIPLVDRIFTRVGASDDLAFNQSTFMVEMVEVANIMNNATQKSLIILDEVGRGTSTFDGLSIAWAVMEYVSDKIKAKTMFATHYHELTELEGTVDGVKNYRIAVKEYNDSVVFLHKIMRGGANKSFGIEVASLAGVPNDIIVRAKEIVKVMENSDVRIDISNLKKVDENAKVQKCGKEIVSVLQDINMNSCTPMQAFDLLGELVEKVKNVKN